VPVTVLCGAHDITLPVKRHAFLAELIPGARLKVIEDAGHLPPLEAPDAVSDAIRDWLQAPMLAR
jgi:pimeloyl-ACP methyl ester carboxylesterase